MTKIHKLSAHESQKIAAGEVVERPANVIKELVENSIDAGATQITIYIEDAGKQLIRVIDDGCGMNEQDAQLCFEHHATSKIKTVDDLNHINTFGFRGEALSSIAAVSKITLITKESSDLHAHQIQLQANCITDQTITSANTGTDISIRDTFYNIPARKKFLKSNETELRQIQHIFQAFCLDYLNIHFKLFSEGKLLFNCPTTDNLHQRLTQLWDHNFASNIILLNDFSKDNIKLSGAISNHHFARYDRSSIFFFVNKRWIKHTKLSSALVKGYLNVIPAGRFPAAMIFIEVDPTHIDVNIHPRKEEVQFLHPRRIEMLLQHAVKTSLEEHLSGQLKKKITFAPATEVPAQYAHSGLQFESRYTPTSLSIPPSRALKKNELAFPFQEISDESLIDQPNEMASESSLQSIAQVQPFLYQEEKNYTLIGQYNKTYLLLEKEEGIYIIDQHAAHERILYELFSKRFEEIATVKLLFPQIIALSIDAIKLLEPAIPLFNQNGIELERFSETELSVQSTPVHLKNQSLQELITEVLSWISENQSTDKHQFLKAINEKIHAQMACKAAVKAGDILTNEQMEQLLTDLHKANNRFTCPHGRPTGWLLSQYEIEKKFKRKL